MKRKNILIFLLLFVIFIGIFYMLTYGLQYAEKGQKKLIEISVIVRGRNDSNWATIKQGIDQASSDRNADVSFITLTSENDAAEQRALMEREIANGAAAILLAAADSDELAPVVASLSEKVPIIAIESPVNSDKLTDYISADNYEMGAVLAREIVERGVSSERIAVISGAGYCANLRERERGIAETLATAGSKAELFPVQSNLSDVTEIVARLADSHNLDSIIVPDPATLEIVAQTIYAARPMRRVNVYGFGATGSIASYLEKQVISAIIVQNDFSIGYLGIGVAVDAIEGSDVATGAYVGYKLITSENMYDPDTQKLLFPYVR